jgi:Fe-S oxidoreductase
MKDDAPSLLRGDLQKQARVVANACHLFEEFAAQLDLPLRAGPPKILLHGHCHQKSMGLLPATTVLLSRIPSCSVVDIDAGCCGMAGSFGYEVEHYEVSRLVGDQRLLPALRHANRDAVVVAPGFSCRLQINHFSGREAVHPTVLLRSCLA